MKIFHLLLLSSLINFGLLFPNWCAGMTIRNTREDSKNSVIYGDKTISLVIKSSELSHLTQKRIPLFESSASPGLKIKVVTEYFLLSGHSVTQHQIEITSSEKMEEDLTVQFPVGSLVDVGKVILPMKNGLIFHAETDEDQKIASYRCAGKPVKLIRMDKTCIASAGIPTNWFMPLMG